MQKLCQKTFKKVSIIKNTGLILAPFFVIVIVLISLYFSGQIDAWCYEKDLERRIPFTKKELIVYGRYDRNVVSFDTNYGTKINYYFPENTPIESIAKFTKENVGQTVEIKIEDIQSAYLNVFNIKVQ